MKENIWKVISDGITNHWFYLIKKDNGALGRCCVARQISNVTDQYFYIDCGVIFSLEMHGDMSPQFIQKNECHSGVNL